MATSFLKLQNNGQSTLYNTITAVQTTIEIPIGHTGRFPASGSFIIEVSTEDVDGNITAYETMLVTGVSSNTFTVTRGYDSTTAIAWTAGAIVKNKIRAEHFTDLATAVNTAENDIDALQAQTAGTTDTVLTHYGMARQAIINGNFDIWQRATTATNTSTDNLYDVADRWSIRTVAASGTFPTVTRTRQLLTPGDLPGSYYFYRIAPNGAGTSFGATAEFSIQQKIEYGTRNLCGLNKTVTVSFWAKSSITNKKIGVYLRQNYGSGGSPSSGEIINGANWTLSTTWTKYTQTFTTNTLVGKTFGTSLDDFLALRIVTMWGSTNQVYVGASSTQDFVGSGNIDIAQVQLCSGSVALPFQPKSYDEELRSCLRYHLRLGYELSGYWLTSSQCCFIGTRFPVAMRTAPTIALINTTPSVNEAEAAIRTATGATLSSDSVSTKGVRNVGITGFTGATANSIATGRTQEIVLFDSEL